MRILDGNKIPIIIVAAFSLFIHLRNLDWGTPNAQRNAQIFKNDEEIKKYGPKMIELRNNYYKEVMKFVDGRRVVTKESFNEVFGNPECKPFEQLPRETVLNCMRGYLLGVVSSDEQHTLVAISRMNPKKLDFNPKHYLYGGVYFYWQSAMLALAKISGYISLNRDVESYLYRPDETARMYIVLRLIGPISVTLIGIFIYLIFNKYTSKLVSTFIAMTAVAGPLFLFYSRMVKPHLFGIMFVTMGVYLCQRILEKQETKYYLWAGLGFGLAVATMYNNITVLFAIIIFEFARTGFKTGNMKWREILYSSGVSLGVFLLANYYLPFNIYNFMNLGVKQNSELYDYINFSVVRGIKYFIDSIRFGYIWLLLPGCLMGFLIGLKEGKFSRFLTYMFVIVLFVTNFYFRHSGIWTLCFIYLIFMFSLGLVYVSRFKIKLLKTAGYLYAITVFVLFFLEAISYDTLYTRTGNLTYAGKWVNKNIPKNASIGVAKGWFLPGTYPALRFFDYRLINVPQEVKLDEINRFKLPKYILTTSQTADNLRKEVPKFYKLIKSWESRGKVLGIDFYTTFIPTENMNVEIYQLKS